MENQMITRTQLDYCPQGYQDLIAFQNARIKALEDKVKMQSYMLEHLTTDPVTKAEAETMDWINERLFR